MATRRTAKQKIVEAAFKLAKTEKWRDISIGDIAKAAKVSLGQMRGEFSGKTAILKSFMVQIDQVVLEKAGVDVVDENARDRLFDIIMLRLEALQPYKAALNNIMPQLKRDPALMLELSGPAIRSAKWMLIAAGLEAHGSNGFVRERGLALVYGRTLDVWLRDDDAGLAKTMAELDRQLRRGESCLKALRGPLGILSVATGFAKAFMSDRRARKRREPDEEPMPQT